MCALISLGTRGRMIQKDRRKKAYKLQGLESFEPEENRQQDLIKSYSKMNFNWHSIVRLKTSYENEPNRTKVYKQKMSIKYIDKIMDRLVKRKSIEYAVAFLEQDDYHNNHLHFAWKTPIEIHRELVAKQMGIKIQHLRDVRTIEGIENAIGYFTKRIDRGGSYQNLYI